jgi:flagellar motor switch/type III secretory pathway protein FliN
VKFDAAALSAGVKTVMGEDFVAPAESGTGATPREASASGEQETKDAGNALVTTSVAVNPAEETGLIERSSAEARLPVQLNVGIPIRDFRVKNLLTLERGSLIASRWVPGEDVPVVSGAVQLAWSEFEVVDTQLAVRLTRLT